MLKRFQTPDELLAFDNGRLEVISIGGVAVAKGSYVPGWRWSSARTAPSWAGRSTSPLAGLVLAGRATLRTPEGSEIALAGGDLFEASLADGYDLWVVGDRPCEILYLSGVEALIAELRHRLRRSWASY